MNQHIYQRRPVGDSAIPNVIFILLILNGLMFALQQMPQFDQPIFFNFALWPLQSSFPGFQPWQLLTYGFLHGGLTHIAFNMFGLWMFGQDLERLWGPKRFIHYFLVCVVGAGVIQLLVAGLQGGLYPTVGASGGLFGLLLAYGLTFPNRIVVPLFPPIPMRAITFVFIYGLLELYLAVATLADFCP